MAARLAPVAIYIFRSQKDAEWFAYTDEPGGKALPANLAPWCAWGDQAASTEISEAMVERDERIRRVIETEGYYLFVAQSDL